MSKNRTEQTTATTTGETENLDIGTKDEEFIPSENSEPITEVAGKEDEAKEDADVSSSSSGTDQRPVPVAAVAQVVETVPVPAVKAGEWTEMRASVLAKNLPQVNRLIAILENFEEELGNNSTYGNPAMFEAGASKTFSMYTRLVAAINDVPVTDIRLAWYALLGYIRNHQQRYDAYGPMMLFRFQPYWSHGTEVAKEFEMFMTTVIESSKNSLSEVGKSYPVSKHLSPLTPAVSAAVLALYA